MKNKINPHIILKTLLREFKVTNAMAILKGDVYECAMLFGEGTTMAKVMEAERHLILQGLYSSFRILGTRACVTWQMPANA